MRGSANVTGDYITHVQGSARSGWTEHARQNWFEGWRLFAVLALTLLALSVWIAGMRQFEVDGVRMVIRFTARTSLLFFCLAFAPPRWRGCGPTPGRDGSAATAAISA